VHVPKQRRADQYVDGGRKDYVDLFRYIENRMSKIKTQHQVTFYSFHNPHMNTCSTPPFFTPHSHHRPQVRQQISISHNVPLGRLSTVHFSTLIPKQNSLSLGQSSLSVHVSAEQSIVPSGVNTLGRQKYPTIHMTTQPSKWGERKVVTHSERRMKQKEKE